jgi:transposase, IS6 family
LDQAPKRAGRLRQEEPLRITHRRLYFEKSRGVPSMSYPNPFKWRHFEAEIILLCVRWYLRYALSYRDLEEMMAERGLPVDHTTIYRWVQRYAPELDKRSRPQLKACNDSWRVDETYIKVKKVWMYLYRAVDSEGNTLEFLLSPTRDAQAAKRFFVKALHSTAGSAPGARPTEEQVEEPTAAAAPQPHEVCSSGDQCRYKCGLPGGRAHGSC